MSRNPPQDVNERADRDQAVAGTLCNTGGGAPSPVLEGGAQVKPREPRQKVLIRARMRLGSSWGDVNILNVSSRGLLIQSRDTPPRGAYLEVRRGRQAIVARVVWSEQQQFGVRTQDPLSIEALIREPDLSAAPARSAAQDAAARVERRSVDRRALACRHESSRHVSRALEYACVMLVGGIAALSAYGLVADSLARPLAKATAALTPGRS